MFEALASVFVVVGVAAVLLLLLESAGARAMAGRALHKIFAVAVALSFFWALLLGCVLTYLIVGTLFRGLGGF